MWLTIVELEDGGLIVAVSDPVRVLPEILEAEGCADGREGGRGLRVDARIAAELDWFLRSDVGKTVRARLAGRARALRPTSSSGQSSLMEVQSPA